MRSGRKVDTATLLELAYEVDNIVGLKDAAGDPVETARLIAQAPPGFEVYSGDDSLTLPLLSVGAVGVIGVATHWTAPEHRELFDAWETGEIAQVQQCHQSLLASFDYESRPDAPNPTPTKVLLRLLGHEVGRCRPPLEHEPAHLEAHARAVLADTQAGRAAGVSA